MSPIDGGSKPTADGPEGSAVDARERAALLDQLLSHEDHLRFVQALDDGDLATT